MTQQRTVPMRTISPRNKRRDVYLLEGSEYIVGTMNIDRHYIGDDLRDIEASYKAKTKCLFVGKKIIENKLKKKYMYTLITKTQ